MIKKFVIGFAKELGYKLERNLNNTSFIKRYSVTNIGTENSYSERISKDPLNADLHLQFADYALRKGKAHLAFAELKMAEYLGAKDDKIKERMMLALDSMPRPELMNHNLYFRLTSLASEITSRNNGKN